jgi:NAD(P)-dependent dehydrogenase (short-subunit alcohol dehydrogenase family)
MKKTVLITGAAGGLGNALVHLFSQEGWRVIACDTNITADESGENDQIIPIRMDVTSDESVLTVFNRLKSAGITLDLIINNAGIDRYFPLSEAPVKRFREVFEVNVFGAYRVNQVLLPLMKKPGGRIVHVGSESLNLTVPFLTYPLSKKLLEGYAKVLRQELHFQGIDVVVIRPGAIETPLLKQVRELDPAKEAWNLADQFGMFAAGAAKEIGKTISPRAAATFIYRKSIISHPSAVYRINNSLQLRVASILPFCWLEKIVRKRLS